MAIGKPTFQYAMGRSLSVKRGVALKLDLSSFQSAKHRLSDKAAMKTLHVWPQSPQICDGEVRLSAIFDGFVSGNKAIEFAVQQSALPHIPSRSDHFALAALFSAMRSFDACVIHGEVSRSLLANLSELNAIWRVWRPQLYRQVQWEAEKVAEKSFPLKQR